tara:strand:+ start:680 stop:1612 length:933 start_codon:yes stop_codon:yes gene_type:complete
MSINLSHHPVLVDEVISIINPQDKKLYFDGTFGQGGYSKKLLLKKKCKIIAIDRDPKSIQYAELLISKYGEQFQFYNEKLSNIEELLSKINVKKFSGIMLDLGISNTQLNNPKRGFSFTNDGPLDMRMNQNDNSLTAEKVINEYSEEKLSKIFFSFGEENNSRKISKTIIEFRKKERIESTSMLSKIIEKVNFRQKIHPSTRVFQALRIYLNKELLELEKFLEKSINMLEAGGRIAIVSFHSLEDRIVKRFFKLKSSKISNSYRHAPPKNNDNNKIELKIITKKVVRPSDSEIKVNPRARSAKLRVAEKL